MSKAPNVLFFMVDELRYPTVYDGPELRQWMHDKLVAQTVLRDTGVEFRRHYAMSTACAPSRTSIFTGEYPSLHGVTQTDGLAKHAWDPGMFWLDPDTVPTLGDYFRAGGYRTYWKGKWHISFADIIVPGTHESLPSNTDDGIEIPPLVQQYLNADRLEGFGFTGWVGPEPHGKLQSNCGWVRDPHFATQALQLIDSLEQQSDDTPWLLVNSFVNPHDIVFFGLKWASFGYRFKDPSIPDIPPPPTQDEDLATKPRCQQSYIDVYPEMLGVPQPPVELYRQFYYFLQQRVEQYILSVYDRLKKSRFFDNTLIIFTSDHGEMLGAHGGMHQKWYNAYEESIHVPMIFSGPLVANTPRVVDGITSHADLLPTLLGFAGIDVKEAQEALANNHTEVRRLVGRDLASVVRGTSSVPNDPIYFMTSDDISSGLRQITGRNPYRSVIPPKEIETVVVDLDGVTWKYSRYYQDTEAPEITNKNIQRYIRLIDDVPDEYEMYNLTDDPLETKNLAQFGIADQQTEAIRVKLAAILDEQRAQKCLIPRAERVSRLESYG